MSEKPVLFNGEMVRAILDGRKTQTRRVIKPQPENRYIGGATWKDMDKLFEQLIERDCPYGEPGDNLWVRETWATPGNYDDIKPSLLPNSGITKSDIAYRATEEYGETYYKWRPSIFMCRWMSRINLQVKDVRVERVQDISEADVLAEGCALQSWGSDKPWPRTAGFAELWDSINEKRGGYGWATNPWVWVVEFEINNNSE
jgi:hypothetical protein